MGFFSSAKSSQASESRAGLLAPEVAKLSPDSLAWQQANVNAAQQGMAAPLNYNLPSLNREGLTEQEANALSSPFQQAVQQALGQQSSQFSMRGFNAPKDLGAIAGSAAMNVAPQFANLMAQLAQSNIARQTEAPLTVEQVRQGRYAQFQNALAGVPGLLGSTNASQGTNTGAGLGYAAATALAGGAGQAGGAAAAKIILCWVAGALYGEGSPQQTMIRAWLLARAQTSRFWAAFVHLYVQYGEQLAQRMPHSWALRAIFRPIFNAILRRACQKT